MHRGGYKLYRSRRGKGGFRCRLHCSRPRVRVVFLLEKMKRAYDRLLVSLASAGRHTWKSLIYTKRAECAYTSAKPACARSACRSNSFYAEAIADCLEFIKRSSSAVESRPVNVR